MRVVDVFARTVSGVPGGAAAVASGRLPIDGHGAAVLCYHDIGRDPSNATDYYVAPELLHDHVAWMRSWGLAIVPLAEVVDRLVQGRDLDGLVALTFDDALHGVLTGALPVLDELRAPATVFVVTGVLGVQPPFWPGADRTLDAGELRELRASGLVTLGSHTATHASLPDVAADRRARELADSRAWLEDLTGAPVDLFAYPFGHHDEGSEEAARAAGYRAACTFGFGRVTAATDTAAIPRFCIGPAHHRFRLARQLARAAAAW